MISLSSLSHHATLLLHKERKHIASTLWEELQVLSPAHTFFDTTVLDIDTARSIKTWATTPYNEKKVAIISFHTITIPAQNALLKIVEEPPLLVQFILVTSNKEALLPTLLSRVSEITDYSHTPPTKEKDTLAHTFLTTAPTKRMTLPEIGELLNRVDEEKRKDRESVRTFIFDLATILQKKKETAIYVEETLTIASHAGSPSSSTKALLEYLSLLLPKL